MKLRGVAATVAMVMTTSVSSEVIRPTGAAQGELRFQELGAQTDDFESGFNSSKWQNAPASLNVGAWTFDTNNAFVSDGKLNIAATQNTHTRAFQDSCWDGVAGGSSQTVQRELYYKSGAVRSVVEGTYGYYEASIKGVNVFPGLSPAFWLYSDGHPFPRVSGEQYVDYSEIDIVELQQADWRSPTDFDEINDMDHNLHARVEENGQIVWKRPKPNPEDQLLHYEAPFDPSEDFHTYAVENRPDKIIWYVDGIKVGEKANKWWHRPMHLIFSMGLRRHLIKYNSACQRADPNPDNIIQEGFPEDATMQVEYVKTWEVLPSVWVDEPNKYTSTDYEVGGSLDVVVNYHGGSNYHVVADKYNGLTVNLVEKNANGFVKVAVSASDANVASDDHKYGGQTTISIDLSNVVAVSELPQGHYYALAPAFKSSNGSDVFLQTAINNINIVDDVDFTPIDVSSVSIGGSNSISIDVGETKQLSASVSPSNATNKQVTWSSYDSSIAGVNATTGLVTGYGQGSTTIEVETVDGRYTDTISVLVAGNGSGGNGNNVVVNSGFEDSNLGTTWPNSWGSAEVVANNANSGNNAGYLNGSGSLVQVVEVEPSTSYVLSAFGKASNVSEKIRLGVKEYGGSEKSVKYKSASYEQQSISFTTGANNTSAKIYFWNGQSGVQAYVDDVVVSTESGNGGSQPNISVTGVSISPQSSTLNVGETVNIATNVLPSNASNKSVSFSSSDAGVASVNSSGLVTAVSSGVATISATTSDGDYTDTAIISVDGEQDVSCDAGWVSVSSVSLKSEANVLSLGSSTNLQSTVYPMCASNKNVVFSSSNASVASVNSAGVVLARSKGTTQITVKTKNLGKTDTVTITVN